MLLGLTTPLKQSIFGFYIGLWVSSHLLVYSSQRDDSQSYNATSVVLLTELTKLCLAFGLYLRYDGTLSQFKTVVWGARLLFLKYALPALLYCVYNNLVYQNLRNFDPGTYNVLMQLRIALTGVLYQLIFKKQLNRHQWQAILCITLGCMLKECTKFTGQGAEFKANLSAWLLLLCQMLASVFAGVYTEVLLKGTDVDSTGVTTNIQNLFMYLQSVIFNLIALVVQGKLSDAIAPENIAAVLSPQVLPIIAIMSVVGIVTGFFLKHLDSVLKAIASAIEVVLTMMLSFTLFGTPLDTLSLTAAVSVGAGVSLYAYPVSEQQPNEPPESIKPV